MISDTRSNLAPVSSALGVMSGTTVQNDEREIRDLVSTWIAATKTGDVDTILSLMTDDAIFLLPGQVMRKDDFAAAARAQSSHESPQIDGSSDIEEIKILGEWAFMRTKLRVVVTPPAGAPSIERAGHTLTILQKRNGKWLLAHDANLLAAVPK